MDGWEAFSKAFLNVEIAWEWAPDILTRGLMVTVGVGLAVVATGILSGLLLALIRTFRVRVLNMFIVFVVDVFRTVPPLVLMVLFYFALPAVNISMSSAVCAWSALSLVLMAFSEEIFWAGIIAIPSGQWEASRSTGLTFAQTLWYVVLPQAVRMTIPPLTNRTIAITKNVSLGSVIAMQDMLGVAQTGVSFSFNATPLTIAAVGYVLLFLPLVMVSRRIERSFDWGR